MTQERMKTLVKEGNKYSWVQGIGAFPAKQAKDLVVGDRIVHNYGSVSEILTIEPNGLNVVYSTRIIESRFTDPGKVYEGIKRRATVLVPIIMTE
jgi:hypothetical protein